MFEVVNARLSIPSRLALIGALFAAPIGFLVYLFVQQSLGDIQFAQREIEGTQYLERIWPGFAKTAASRAVDRSEVADRARYDDLFGTAATSKAFAEAGDLAAKLEAGKTLIGDIADKSNLTLDPDLDSFYAMDAATVRIPGIAAAAVALGDAYAEPASAPNRIVDIAFAVDRLSVSADDAASSLGSAMKNNGAGETAKALSAPAAAMKVAADALLAKGKTLLGGADVEGLPESVNAMIGAVDAVWAPTNGEVARLLRSRIGGLETRMLRSLALAGVFVAAAVALSLAIAGGLTRRLRALVEVMDRLVANDPPPDIPFLGDAHETGKIAQALAGFKDSVIERSKLKSEKALEQEFAAEREANEAAKEETQRRQAMVVDAVAEGLGRLAASDLNVAIHSAFPREFERLREDLNTAASQLRQAMTAIGTSVGAIHLSADEIASAVDNLQGRTEQQASSLEQTAAALDEITRTVRKSAEGAAQCRSVVAAADANAKRSVAVVGQAVEAMGGIAKSAEQISQIVGLMDEIAFQTNLLALNAGVEAARAGDAGRGFAVVASEVRALAQRSADAAKEIKTLISASGAQVAEGVKLVAETGRSLETIMTQVADINAAIGDIAGGAGEQASGLREVNDAINQMDQVTQQNAAMVEESTAACRLLAQEARQLAQLVARFQIDGVSGEAAASSRGAASPPVQRLRARRTA